ncbi:MAG: hypothetical protein C0473_00765 [Cyanobacteria bacterium DS3.002]|nr:hypothetical protein [Cyanobacteria bacterium DS3.002]MBA4049481.1 hypothetical protein [Cyanobacteria bacterium DS2.008]MBA4074746.1 hypothetical protein [Cyanobacteria bacterium PR.023]
MNDKPKTLALSLTILIATAASVTSCANAESRKPIPAQERTKESNKESTINSNSDSSSSSSTDSNYDSSVSSSSDPDSVTVSHTVEGPAHELTMEEMLLAQPMPMSGEERDFVFSHKSVQKLQEWSLKDYLDYTNVPLGRQQIWAEGQRWIGIRKMVRAQAEFTRNFLAGKASKPKPLPKGSKPQEVEAEPTFQGNSEASSGSNAGSSDPGEASAGASSPGYAGDDGGGSYSNGVTPSMNLAGNNSAEDLFLSNQSVLTGAQAEITFNQLKKLRTDISTYCTEIEELRKKAAQRELTKKLDDAVNSVSWD